LAGGPKVRSTLNLLLQRTDSEWRDDPNDGDDLDWLDPGAARAAANEERVMVN
jgi:hypothetical protein